jgi:hypothetical protein
MNRFAISAVRAVALFALGAGTIFSQAGTGVIKGVVSDGTGAVVPGVRLTLTHIATNLPRSAETNNEGIFYLPSLPPGNYTLTGEARGFKKWSGGLSLQVGETLVINFALDVGSVDTVVEVSGVASSITTEGSAIADVKDSLRIRQLPLNGRAITNLFNLTPGVEGGGNARVGGLKVGSLEILLDGVSLVDRFGGGVNRVQPGLDTIEEFRIEVTGSSAQFSRPATVEMVTKSGTNQFHGSAFHTHRNNFGGLRSRARQDGNSPAKLIRNEFGVSAGGPVLLPTMYNGRNRTFWFAAYEGSRQRQLSFIRDTVPTQDMWRGDFNQIINTAGRQTSIFDPLTTGAAATRSPFANNLIPRSRIHPFFGVMESITHLPTRSINPYQGPNMEEFYPNLLDTGSTTIKIDHRFSEKDSIAGRFTRTTRDNSQTGGRFGSPRPELTNGFGTGRGFVPIHSFSLRHTHVFQPNLFHDLLLLSLRTANSNGTLADFTDWPKQLGLPNPFGALGWPTMGAGNFGWDADNRKDERLTGHGIESSSTWIKGKHSIKFGGKLRYEYNNIRELQQSQGSHTFGNAWTANYDPVADNAVPFTGDGLATMALGLPTFLSNQFNRGYFYFEQQELGLYFHDSWKATRRLTLELGLRWDKWSAYEEKFNRMVNVDFNTFASTFQVITPKKIRMEDLPGVPPSVLASWANRGLRWKTAHEVGYPSNLVRADNNNFGPRIGAAFRITDKTILRGGYGEYFWTMPLSQILQTSRTNPPLNLRFTNPIGTLDGTNTFAVRTAPRPEFFIGRATVDTEGIIPLPPSAQSMMPLDGRNWKEGRSQSWNLTFERELMKNTALRFSYIGTHGRDLEQRFSLNAREAEFNYVARTRQNPPGNRDLLRVNNDWAFRASNRSGYSNNHSLQAEVERRYHNGLAFQWFYVFTRSLTTTDEGGFSSGNGSINAVNGVPEVPENIQLLGGGSSSFDQLLRLVYYNSVNIPAQRIRWNGIYDLPFGKGKKFANQAGRGLNQVIGGWQMATIGEWRGGNWSSVSPGAYLFGDPTLRPNQRVLLTFAGRPQRLWFRGDFDPRRASDVDPQALQSLVAVNQADRILRPLGANLDNRLPQTLANGTIRQTPIGDTVNPNARAFFLGPGSWNLDVSLFKNFQLSETIQLRFTADFFNAPNSPMDGNPNATTGLQDLSTQSNSPRIIQFSARLSW